MGDRRAEVGVPGVQVGVEVDQRDRPEPLLGGPQQRVRDRVVAAEGQEVAGLGEELGGGGLDLADRLGDVERVAGDVARVRDLLLGQRPDLEGGVPGAEQA